MNDLLTPARREALAIIVRQHRTGDAARYSNETSADTGSVHWKPTDWLLTHAYARRVTGNFELIEPTAPGLDRHDIIEAAKP